MSDEAFYHFLLGFLVSVLIVVTLFLNVLGLPPYILVQPMFLMLTLFCGLVGAFLWIYFVASFNSKGDC